MKKEKKKEYDKAKTRSKGLAYAVLEEVANIDTTEIIAKAFITAQTEFEHWLIKQIELQLVKAKNDREAFIRDMNKFFKKTAQEIKSQKKYHEYFEFCYRVYITMEKRIENKENNLNVAVAYYDILIEIAKHLAQEDNFVYGVTTDNKLLQRKELYPNLDVYFQEVVQKIQKNPTMPPYERKMQLVNYMKSKGIDVNEPMDVDLLLQHEKAVINMHFIMAFIVDETSTEFCLPEIRSKEYMNINLGAINIPTVNHSLAGIRELVTTRKRLLPKKGVYVSGFADGNVQEVYFKEKFYNDKLYLLYKIKADGKYIMGFYDVLERFFFSWFLDDKKIACMLKHRVLETFILELYAVLTSDVNVPWEIRLSVEDETGTGNEGKLKSYNKKDYDKLIKSVESYVRKLPMGATCSDEAKAEAKKYGIELEVGMTFVRGFTKAVRVNKKEM